MSTSHNEPSKVSAIKDQAVGAVKKAIGNVIGNNAMEVEGQAQKVHGKNEYQEAKAAKNQNSEPLSVHHDYDPKTYNQHAPASAQPLPSGPAPPLPPHDHAQPIPPPPSHEIHPTPHQPTMPAPPMPPQDPGHFASTHETRPTPSGQAVPPVPSQAAPPLPPQAAPPVPPLTPEHSVTEPSHASGTPKEHAEGKVEGESVSTFGALKDKTMGSLKEMYGSMTGNQDIELKGKAQNMHGRNEAEFVKAEKQGLSEPEHYAHGTKKTEHAQGQVVAEEPSKMSAWKDQAVGSMKETFGSATGNTNSELAGKAQKIHGKNEAEFAKAHEEGLSEPQHYAHGTKTTQHAHGEVVAEEPSKMSALKDKAVGSAKETFGSATNNANMELEGKAQKMHATNSSTMAEPHNTTLNA